MDIVTKCTNLIHSIPVIKELMERECTKSYNEVIENKRSSSINTRIFYLKLKCSF